jgi:hypothetical protein
MYIDCEFFIFRRILYKFGCMVSAGEYNGFVVVVFCFCENLPVNVTGGAVIAAVICSVFLYHRVLKVKLCVGTRECLSGTALLWSCCFKAS